MNRNDFPILATRVRGKRLVYLDNAATTQKPQAVIDAVDRYYREQNSNIHRGVHFLSELATREFEETRVKVKRFVNAGDVREIVFTSGTTGSINLVAQSFVRPRVKPGDEILISHMEHHSNIVPWQIVCEQTGAALKVAPINDAGELIDFEACFTPRTKFVSLVHVSNALGTVNPVRRIAAAALERGIPILLDGAQAVAHMPVDLRELGCDFYAFSGHKLYGPTGTGVLYGKAGHLEAMPPYQGGGDMILSVSFEKTVYNKIPHKFEAGTPNIEGVIGLGAAIDYLGGRLPEIQRHEAGLLDLATRRLAEIPGVRIVGTAREKAGAISFLLEGVHPHDVGTILDREGIAIRTGHHCAQPVMERFGIPATARASFAMYNEPDDVEALAEGLRKVAEVFA